MNSGGLVSDEIMNGIVAERMAAADIARSGVLLDGFPRTADQADALEGILRDLEQQLTVAVNLEVPVEEVTARMMARARSDDTEEAITRRLELYDEQTSPLLDWFDARGLLETVDGLGSKDDIFRRLSVTVRSRLT